MHMLIMFVSVLAVLLLLPLGAPGLGDLSPPLNGNQPAENECDVQVLFNLCGIGTNKSQGDGSGNQPEAYGARLLELREKLTQLKEQEGMLVKELHELIFPSALPPKGSFSNPADSCKDIPDGSPSGKYWIRTAPPSYAAHQYCDLSNTRCGTRGWMRVANLDMSDTSQDCPKGFRNVSGNESGTVYRGCGAYDRSCVHTVFPVYGAEYTKVCGRVNAYQYYTPDAFFPYYDNKELTIDDQYVDGVSLTRGEYPRNHIWTFAAAVDETRDDVAACPCTTNRPFRGVVPPFIGEDYFCDTGSRSVFERKVYTDDPLWDGRGCGPTSTCCQFPWFCKTLSKPTTDDIELRLCIDEWLWNEDVILTLAEIYVQ